MNSPGQCELGRDGKKVEGPGLHLGTWPRPEPSVFLSSVSLVPCFVDPPEGMLFSALVGGGGTSIITAAWLEKQRSPSDLPSWLRADFLVDLSQHSGARLLGISHLPDLWNPLSSPPCYLLPPRGSFDGGTLSYKMENLLGRKSLHFIAF